MEDVAGFKKWVEDTDVEKVADILDQVGFRLCYYYNPIDKLACKKTWSRLLRLGR